MPDKAIAVKGRILLRSKPDFQRLCAFEFDDVAHFPFDVVRESNFLLSMTYENTNNRDASSVVTCTCTIFSVLICAVVVPC